MITATPEQIEALAAQGYSPADVKRLVGAANLDAVPLREAYRCGSQRWSQNGKATPPPADRVILENVRATLLRLGGSTDAQNLSDATGYLITDVVSALEALFDNGEVELFTQEGDSVNVRVEVVPAKPSQPGVTTNGGSHQNTKKPDPQVVETAFAEGLTFNEACVRIGVSSATLYKRSAEFPEIKEAIERGRQRAATAGKRQTWSRAPKNPQNVTVNTESLIHARDELFRRSKSLVAQREALDRELASTQEAHQAIVKLLQGR